MPLQNTTYRHDGVCGFCGCRTCASLHRKNCFMMYEGCNLDALTAVLWFTSTVKKCIIDLFCIAVDVNVFSALQRAHQPSSPPASKAAAVTSTLFANNLQSHAERTFVVGAMEIIEETRRHYCIGPPATTRILQNACAARADARAVCVSPPGQSDTTPKTRS